MENEACMFHKNCDFERDVGDCPDRCLQFRGNTKFDRIRAMSDEEKRTALIEYFSKWANVGDSYIYDLMRVKEGFQYGTVSLDDFVEWDDERVTMLVDELLEWGRSPYNEEQHG